MIITNIKTGKPARDDLQTGINIVANAVKATLGPVSRNVDIERASGDIVPLMVHDGVTVAESIKLEDQFQNMGAQHIKEAARNTNRTGGDGTTTATILTQSLTNEALKMVEAGGKPMVIKREIEEALKQILAQLDKLSKKITTTEEIEQVATISSSDPVIGKLVAEALDKVGNDGVVTVEEGKDFNTSVEYKQGMEVDRGYLSPYFVTNQDTVEAVIENPYIFLTDKKLNYGYDILPLLEKCAQAGIKDLVIFAGEVVEEALALLVVNKLRGAFNIVAITAPAFGDRRIEELEDLGLLTGATPFIDSSGRDIESVTIEELGRADKVIADRDRTIISGSKGDPKAIEARMNHLREQLKVANTGWDKDIKKQRLAKLAGGVAVINVGAHTEVEIKEKKERVIDAVNATKAAVEEGIVAGGEITLLNLASSIEADTTGARVLKEALKEPFKVLLENSGYDYAEMREKLSGKKYPYGVDVTDGTVKDLIKAGVIDPVKVTRAALENSVSVAIMVATTEVLIANKRDDK